MPKTKTWKPQQFLALRMLCNGDMVTPRLHAEIDALLAERDELFGALKEINNEIPVRPKLPLVNKIADITRSALAACQARWVLSV